MVALKSFNSCGAIAWAPSGIPGAKNLLACGSVAGAVDLSFSSNASLQVRCRGLTFSVFKPARSGLFSGAYFSPM